MFTPWKCGDCGAHGKIRHEREHTAADVARWTTREHARKAPACHRAHLAAVAAMDSPAARLTPRDRHIIITARIKRKLMADALRVQRKADPAGTRTDWLAGKATRKGYAFT